MAARRAEIMRVGIKLGLCAAFMSAAIGYVAYLGASGSWQYYLLVDECAAEPSRWNARRLRVNGRVTAGSLNISADRRGASFLLAGIEHSLPVTYQGVLPDNLTDGREVVVEGTLERDGVLRGTALITRCASKYAPAGAAKPSESGDARTTESSVPRVAAR